MNHDRLIFVMRGTLLAMLAASWAHLAELFALFYSPLALPVLGWPVPMGAIAATAVDGTLYVLAETLGSIAAQRARGGSDDDRPVGPVYAGLVALLGISALANLDASLTNLAGQRPLIGQGVAGVDWLDIVRATVGMASFPIMGAYLTHSLTNLQAARARVTGGPAPASIPASVTRAAQAPRQDEPRRPPLTKDATPTTKRAEGASERVDLTPAQYELAQRYVRTASALELDLEETPPKDANEAIAEAQDEPRSIRTVRRWRGWARDAGMMA